MKPLYSHQQVMADFALKKTRVLNLSDAGTGKTRGTIEGYHLRRTNLPFGSVKRCLVVAPLSILGPSWEADIHEYSTYEVAIAHGSDKKRRRAFDSTSDFVLINHDGIKWVDANPGVLDGFTDLVIDEFTAFKNRTAQRSAAMRRVGAKFDHVTALSGTPNPNTVLDLWHPMLVLDAGKRLGNRFFQFRSQVCVPEQVGPRPEHIKWVDRPGAAEAVADRLSDITVRFRFEDCLDIPENVMRHLTVDMPPEVMDAYATMEADSVLATQHGLVSAIHAGARVQKMLQILSGAVYNGNSVVPIHNDRYELVMQLVSERQHSIVAFNWSHQREALCELATKMGITHAVIDGSVPASARSEVIEAFQAGRLQVLFCHPQSAGHGLTLTRGRTTIWCSPTYNAEHFQQFNRRIYRAGQTQRTETICIAAKNTKEIEVYERLNGKISRMDDLLTILTANQEAA